MRSWDALPSTPFQPSGELTDAFLRLGLADMQAAGRYLQALPYGRTADRADFRGVLREGRGTCSTKHALLAALASEQRLPVQLTLGIYSMQEANTPGVGPVLRSFGLSSIPEAHCYLTHRGARIDVTRLGSEPSEPISSFHLEEFITPEGIGDYKVAVHQRILEQWCREHPEQSGGLSFERIWSIREACIKALEG